MTPTRPHQHGQKANADDPLPADEQPADCPPNATSNPVDARLNERLRSVSRWSALFVGALTVVLAEKIAAWLPLGDTATSLALFPVSLSLLYVLLTVAAAFERR